MRTFVTLFVLLAPIFANAQSASQTETMVIPRVVGHRVYVPGTDRLDLPTGLHGLMLNEICKAMGFARLVDFQIGYIQISTKTEFAVVALGEQGKPTFLIPTLNPANGQAIAVVDSLTCSRN